MLPDRLAAASTCRAVSRGPGSGERTAQLRHGRTVITCLRFADASHRLPGVYAVFLDPRSSNSPVGIKSSPCIILVIYIFVI